MQMGGLAQSFFQRIIIRNLAARPGAVAAVIVAFLVASSPAQGFDQTNPGTFFNEVAGRLLRTELQKDLSRLQLYPTNEYTPSVHRLLQLTANLYDATTNRTETGYPYLPSVFRPLFTNDNGVIYLCGYSEETGTNLLHTPVRDLALTEDRDALQGEDMVLGIPAIIGVKKGYPAINEVASETVVTVMRHLEFRRMPGDPNLSPVVETNQMYLLAISNLFGIEAWNSYRSAFPRDLELRIDAELTLILSSEAGVLVSNRVAYEVVTNVAAHTWHGYTNSYNHASSIPVLLHENFVSLPWSTWRPNDQPELVPASAEFERNAGFPVPRWWVTLHKKVRFALIDVSISPSRLVGHASLANTEHWQEISGTLMSSLPNPPHPYDAWNTNGLFNSQSLLVPTLGVVAQYFAGLGPEPVSPEPYVPFEASSDGTALRKAIDAFRVNFGLSPIYYPQNLYFRSNVFYAPLSARRTLFQKSFAQVNDPLVYQLWSDWRATNHLGLAPSNPRLRNLGLMNERFEPWGGKPFSSPGSVGPFDIRIKDPRIWRSDDWDFPSGEPLNFAALGRIHRGSPWQTVYLKSDNSGDAPLELWRAWTGNSHVHSSTGGEISDAAFTRPVTDRSIADALAFLLNPAPLHQLASVNDPRIEQWQELLNGLTVQTNSATDDELMTAFLETGPMPPLETVAQPPGSSQTLLIANAIQSARMEMPGGYFKQAADIVAVPELSTASPWLNTNGQIQLWFGISDEAYEALPVQLLSLLRSDSIASAGFLNGQRIVRFTGLDDYSYRVERSSNLVDWTAISTNEPVNGSFELPPTPADGEPAFYRSMLIP